MGDIEVGNYVRCIFQPLAKGQIVWVEDRIPLPNNLSNRDVGVKVPNDQYNLLTKANETYVFKAWQLEVMPEMPPIILKPMVPKIHNYEELKDKFTRDVAILQANCEHRPSEWMQYMWAPGHSAGQVKVCLDCNKILKSSNASTTVIERSPIWD